MIQTLKEEKFIKRTIKLEVPIENDIENFWRIKDATLSADMIKSEIGRRRSVFLISFKKMESL